MIALRLAPDEGDEGFVQPLAADELWTAAAVAAGARPARRPPAARAPDAAPGEWRLVYDGPGIDLGHPRRVVARVAASGERLVEFDDGELYWIAADGGAIERVASGGGAAAAVRERALGAPLALALAARGVHLLHASAVVARGGVIALAAGSGVGKSTLAAAANRLPALAARRVADDVLPVRLAGEPLALPHFPQLKLAAAEAYPSAAPASVPLAALVELDRGEPGGPPPRLERLSPAAAALALARATVAARLFDPALLASHLEACAAAASRLPVARLTYPGGDDRLGEVLAQVVRVTD